MPEQARRAFALVTGASQGLGRAFARDAAERGYDLVLVALPGSGLAELARELRARHGREVLVLEGDLTDAAARRALLDAIADLPVTLVINNAGVGSKGAFALASWEAWRRSIELNVVATTELTHALVPKLQRAGRAHVLNVASLAAFYPMPYFGVYASTKAFLLHWSLALRNEIAGSGVSVTVLAPAGVWTNPEVIADIEAQGALGRWTSDLPDALAHRAIDAALRERALVIPGVLNRLLLIGALVPKVLLAWLIGRRWGRLHGR